MIIKHTLIASLAASTFAIADTKVNQDSIIFKDGGNLYGEFKGFSDNGKIIWTRKGAQTNQEYEVKAISQISINGGRPTDNAPHNGYVSLVNGDRVPCQLSGMDEKNITIQTKFSGELTLPRNTVESFHPSPNGAPVIINGFGKNHKWENRPFSIHSSSTNKASQGKWDLHGASYYADPSKVGMLINPDIKLPDEFVCKFVYAYKDYPSINLILHADMAVPKKKEEEKEKEENPKEAKKEAVIEQIRPRGRAAMIVGRHSSSHNVNRAFGSCLYLSMDTRGTYSLKTASFDPETKQPIIVTQTSKVPRSYRRINEELPIEVRVSRKRSQVTLIVKGKTVGEWFINEDDYPKLGNQLAFFCTPSSGGSVRLSNFSISEWHGVPDTPKSQVNAVKDVILLGNNTDRFAGKLDKFDGQHLFFSNSYFNLKFPQEKVKRVNFATQNLAEAKEFANQISVDFYKHGNVTGLLQPSSSKEHIVLKTQYADQLSIPKANIRSIKLEDVSDLIESWSKKH